MRLFCTKDHSKPEPIDRDYSRELLQAKAKLARLKKLPVSAFAEKTHERINFTPWGPIRYSVDNKDDAIAVVKAAIAELEVLTEVESANKEATE
jgi:hypothetical protein